jgi:hypothetical protein
MQVKTENRRKGGSKRGSYSLKMQRSEKLDGYSGHLIFLFFPQFRCTLPVIVS